MHIQDPVQTSFLKATRLVDECCSALGELQDVLDSFVRTDAFHSTYTRSKAESYISTLEKQVTTASCNVKHMANSIRPPINRLPREIFTMILSHVRDEVVYGHSMSVPLLANWVFSMIPMLVCRQWRRIILTTPLFWVNIYNVDREQMRLSLTRAGTAHLELRLFNRQPQTEFPDNRSESSAENNPFLQAFEMNSEDYRSLVAPMFPKLRGLFMDVTCEDNSGKLPSWFMDYVSPLPAPHLRSLYIELFFPTIIVTHNDPQINDALPMILGGSTPELKEIKLSYFTTWPHNSFTNLTKIFLFRQSQNRTSLFEFLDFLRQSPQLEDLALMHAGPDISLMEISPTLNNTIGGPGDSSIQPVILNKLQHLDISAWISSGAVGTFIQHLVIPETTVVAIWDMTEGITDSESVALLLPLTLCPDLDTGQVIPPRRDDRPKTLRLTDLSAAGRYTPLFLCSKDSLQLNGGLALRQTLLPLSSVGMLCRLEELHLARVDRVIWNSAPVLTEAEWSDLLQCMPNLERLFLDDTSAVSIVKALTVSADLQSDDEEVVIPCPQLKCLSLTFGQLDEYISVHFPLSIMVTLRALKGHPLEVLHVNSGNSFLMAYASAIPGELVSLETRGIVKKVMQSDRQALPPSVSPEWPTPAYKWLNVV